MGITACSKSQAPAPENSQAEDPVAETATTYHISIPATMGEDDGTKAMSFDNSGATPTSTSTFSTTEKVYVYNKSQSVMLGSFLTPSNLSNDDKNCDLTGDLTGTIKEGDELWLLYNADEDGNFNYNGQNGKATGVKAGAKAVVTVNTASPLTTSDAHFTNLQSMFRFKFVDENSSPVNVSSLTLYSTNGGTITRQYYGKDDSYETDKIRVNPSPATSDYLYAAVCFYPSHVIDGNKMVFLASNGTYLYRGKKAEPASGFANGKYYYNTNPIQLTKEGEFQPPVYYDFTGSVEQHDNDYIGFGAGNDLISLEGTSFGYRILLTDSNSSIINMGGLTATRFEEWFIRSYYNSFTLDISGANNISCPDTDRCISASQTLKLRGCGTLTVTSNNATLCGLSGSNYTPSNNNYTTTSALDVSGLLAAEEGYTVTRSARIDNPDGTYTWTYTVCPPPNTFRVNASGKLVYFSPGNLQYNGTESTYKWRFAQHQYDFVGAWDTSTWVDLFGWGTWTGDTPNPTKQSTDDKVYSWDANDFTKESLLADASQRSYDWWTLSASEWVYVLNYHTYGMATINTDITGIILLPGAWTGSAINTSHNSWSNNTYTSAEWGQMEAAGAVFLPAAGERNGTTVYSTHFNYYTRNHYNVLYANNKIVSIVSSECYQGRSVRLVRNAN